MQEDPAKFEVMMGGQVNGIGVVVIPTGDGRPVCFQCQVPEAVLGAFARGGQFIFFLEALAQCLPYWIWWGILRGPYWSFIDNASAQWALSKAYSANEEANKLVTLFWCAVTLKGGDPWFERVPTKANISDAISRGSLKEAVERGWRIVALELSGIWNILTRLLVVGYDQIPGLAREVCLAARKIADIEE